jgi:hypothetical protein
MAYTPTSWTTNIREVLAHLSDKDYQTRAWLGVGPEVSSPEELYSQIFDDFSFSEFLKAPDIDISAEARSVGHNLLHRLDAFFNSSSSRRSPEAVLRDPDWEEIRRLAQRFGDLLELGNQ